MPKKRDSNTEKESDQRADFALDGLLEQSDPVRKPFIPGELDRSVIVIPLLQELQREAYGNSPEQVHKIIIVLNDAYAEGLPGARAWVLHTVREIIHANDEADEYINGNRTGFLKRYVFCSLLGKSIRELARRSRDCSHAVFASIERLGEPVENIWPDFEIRVLSDPGSNASPKGAGGQAVNLGANVNWAVIDSGIDVNHPHFQYHQNLKLTPPLEHLDFTGKNDSLSDPFGHGTHVAGIIAGHSVSRPEGKPRAVIRNRDEHGHIEYLEVELDEISGKAPQSKLVNLRVIDETGRGDLSSLLAAIGYIAEVNDERPTPLIHGVNISVGYATDPQWEPSGVSPLRVEINRLVRTGTIVVVADGDPIKGDYRTYQGNHEPGSSERALSVSSTYKGSGRGNAVISSPKKMQLDENEKPDIISSVERVISCAAGLARARALPEGRPEVDYIEDAGTSQAAAQISGSIAAFLSVRKDFIGQPEKLKKLFTSAEGIAILNSSLSEDLLKQVGKEIKRTKVFVSYSHRDKKEGWLERLKVHLGPLQREGILDLWDDTRIKIGEKWKDKITEALQSARVAVLLVSADFLNSEFIQSEELPELLSAAESEGVVIMSVIIKPCLFKRTKSISQFQSVNPPDQPLIRLTEGEREEYWLKLAEEIDGLFSKGEDAKS